VLRCGGGTVGECRRERRLGGHIRVCRGGRARGRLCVVVGGRLCGKRVGRHCGCRIRGGERRGR